MTTNTAPEHPSTWDDTLSRMEADVRAAEALLASRGTEAYETGSAQESDRGPSGTSWAPPVDLGPLPEPLLARALSVLARQHAVAEGLGRAQAATTRQRDFADRVTDATVRHAAPAYLDVSA